MSAVDVLRTPEERFADLPGNPFDARYATLPDGLRMHYIDEGPVGKRRLPVIVAPVDDDEDEEDVTPAEDADPVIAPDDVVADFDGAE